jgi:integrase
MGRDGRGKVTQRCYRDTVDNRPSQRALVVIERAAQRVLDATERRVIEALLDGLESRRSVATYANDLAAFFRFCEQRHVRPIVATTDDFAAFYADLTHRPYRPGRFYAPDTRRRMLSVVRRFYAEAEARGLLPDRNPVPRTLRVRGEVKKGEPALTPDEVRALLAAVDRRTTLPIRAERDRLLLAVLVWLGLRASEVVALRFGDLRRRGGYDIIVVRGKGGHIDEARVPPNLVEAIRSYRRRLVEFGIDLRPDDPIFFGLSRSGTPRRVKGAIVPLSTRELSRIADRYLADIGRDGRRTAAHLLRRTSVTLVYQAAHDPLIAQRHARHRSLTTTVDHYIRPADELADAGIDYLTRVLPNHHDRH